MIQLLHRVLLGCAAVVALTVLADEPAPSPAPTQALPIADLQRDTAVDFEKEILPFLKNSCLACHNTTKAKGGLNLETPQFILKGGDTGAGAAPGKSGESLIFKAAAHLDRELIMPPKDNKANAPHLTPDQLALLKLWIDQGAKGEVRAAAPIAWLEQPPALDPIFAVALTPDGQFAACGRGNRIDIYHVPSRQLVTRLADVKLTAAGFTNAAHRDLVNALAFSPDGNLLASAGYREVKLWSRPRDVQKPILTVSNAIEFFTVSPDRRWLAAPAPDNGIALVDLSTGRQTRLLSGHSNTITSLKFSPDNQRLASIARDDTLRVWSLSDGTPAAATAIPAETVSFAWLADGAQLAIGSSDGLIRVLGTGQSSNALSQVKELKAHTAAVTAVEALANGKELLSASADGTLRHWDVTESKVLREFTNGTPVTTLAVRPDGKGFAAAGTNRLAKLWNIGDGKFVAEIKGDRYAYELVAETERAFTVAKSDVEFRKKSLDASEAENKKQTERLAKAAETNAFTEKVFAEKQKAFNDVTAGRTKAEKEINDLLAEIKKVTETFESADKSAKEAAAAAKTASARAAETRLAAERAGASKEDVEKIATDAAAVAARTKAATNNDLPPDAKAAAQQVAEDAASVAQNTRSLAAAVTADASAKTRIADEAKAAAEKAIEEVAALSFAAGQLKPGYDKTLAEAPDKMKTATNTIESATKSVASAETDLKKAETRRSVTGHELELATQGAGRASNSLASAKTALGAVESAQKQVESVLEANKKKAAGTEQIFHALAFSPDNLTLATVAANGRVQTWSAETGVPFEVFRRNVEDDARNPRAIDFLDAQTILAPDAGHRIVAWNLNPPWTLERAIGSGDIDSPLADRVNAVDFSPDGRTLATAGGEPTRSGEVMLWHVADGQLVRTFTNVHSDAVLSLDFSADGKFLASAAADRFVRVVELAGGRVVKAFEGHTSYVLGVAWKRDSRTLASAGADKMIKVWDFVTGERRKNIEGAEKEVTAISFVGATGEAVAASGDSQVRLLRENGDKVRSFEGASEFMNAVAVTPDGLTVIAGGQDGTMHIWNGNTGAKVVSFGPAR